MPEFKIVVFTYDRYEKITTAAALESAGVDYDVVCHTPEAAQKFIAAGKVNPKRLLISNAPKGLANNRNWWIDNHLAAGQWALMLVDDWISSRELDDYDTRPRNFVPVDLSNTTFWGNKFRTQVLMEVFLKRAEETMRKAQSENISLAGFASYNNPLFRMSKWRRNVLADGRALLMRKTGLRFDVNAQMIDDYAFTALNIRHLNGTLVNQWIVPECSRYTKGSYGALAQRMPKRMAECFYLTQRYKGIIKIAKKKGWPFGSHIAIVQTGKRKSFAIAQK